MSSGAAAARRKFYVGEMKRKIALVTGGNRGLGPPGRGRSGPARRRARPSMSRRAKPSFDVEMPPPLNLPPAAPSADRFAVLLGGQQQPAAHSSTATAQPAIQPAVIASSTSPAVPTPELAQQRRGARTHERKRDGARLRRLHVRLPVDLERQLKRYCVDHERAAGDVVVDALNAYLRK